MPRRTWSNTDLEKLARLRERDFLSWSEIGRVFERSSNACQMQYYKFKNGLISADAPIRQRDSGQFRAFVSVDQVADRDARNRLRHERADITAELFGDPLPGRSALDLRNRPEPSRPDRRAVQIGPTPTLYCGKFKHEGQRA